MKTRYISLRLVALALIALVAGHTALARQRTIMLSQHGITPEVDNSLARLPEVLDALGQLPEDTLTLVMLPGIYKLSAEALPTRQLYISNHDQLPTPRPIGVLLEGRRHVVLDGMGAQLSCQGQMLPIAILGSEGVEVRRLTIDFEVPAIMQVRIEENLGDKGIVFSTGTQRVWSLEPQGFTIHGSNTNVPISGIVYDVEAGGTTAYRISDLDYSTAGAKLYGGKDSLVHAPRWVDARLKPGYAVAMRSYFRPNPGVFVDASRDTRLEQVTIHYADGMGILAQNSHNLSLRRFDVRPTPGGRLFSTQADATHFSGCSGHVDVRESYFEGMMDDAINVHGVYLRLVKRLDRHTIVGRYMHDQAWGMEWGVPGDTVQLVASRTFDVLPERMVIESIRPYDQADVAGAREFAITFTKPLPRTVTPEMSIGIENMRKIPSVTFSDNTIYNNRARGTLFNTSKPILVERNYFHRISGSGILVSSDCNMWFESGQTRQMVIRGNVFEDVLTSLYQFTEAVISIFPVIPELEKQQKPFYGDGGAGILVEGNVFKTFDTPLLFARSVDGLLWRDNQIIETTTFPRYHHNQERYRLEGSRGVDIRE